MINQPENEDIVGDKVEQVTVQVDGENRQINDNVPNGSKFIHELLAKFIVLCLFGICAVALIWYQFAAFLMTYMNFITLLLYVFDIMYDRKVYKKAEGKEEDTCNHIVLTSHYQEDRWLLERVLDSVEKNIENTSGNIHVVVAVEEKSKMIQENWDISELEAKYSFPIHFPVHKLDKTCERPGLGSNLRNAINHILEKTNIPIEKTIVSKIDGNCAVEPDFLRAVEVEWKKQKYSRGVIFQPICTEVDDRFEEYKHLNMILQGVNCVKIMTSTGTHIFPNSHVHCAFCIPLETIVNGGSWDPWMIQEDCLATIRCSVGCDYKIRVRILRSPVYNAPSLSLSAFYNQHERCTIHGLFAAGYFLGNIRKLRWFQIPELLSYIGYVSLLAFSYLAFSSLISVLINADNLPAPLLYTNLGMAIVTNILAIYYVAPRKTVYHFLRCTITHSVGFFIKTMTMSTVLIKFLFISEASESYKTTPTLNKE